MMKKLKLNFDGAKEMLTREQMKKVLGGDYSGGCCAHTANWTSSRCDYPDSASAQTAASAAAVAYGVQTFYCCQCPAH